MKFDADGNFIKQTITKKIKLNETNDIVYLKEKPEKNKLEQNIKFHKKITLKRMEDAKKIVFDDIISTFGIKKTTNGYYYAVERSKESFTLKYNKTLNEVISKLHNLLDRLAYLTIQEQRLIEMKDEDEIFIKQIISDRIKQEKIELEEIEMKRVRKEKAELDVLKLKIISQENYKKLDY